MQIPDSCCVSRVEQTRRQRGPSLDPTPVPASGLPLDQTVQRRAGELLPDSVEQRRDGPLADRSIGELARRGVRRDLFLQGRPQFHPCAGGTVRLHRPVERPCLRLREHDR